MAFVSKLMAAPASLFLTLALLCSVCVVGCGSEADTGGAGQAEPSGGVAADDGEMEDESDEAPASDTEEDSE